MKLVIVSIIVAMLLMFISVVFVCSILPSVLIWDQGVTPKVLSISLRNENNLRALKKVADDETIRHVELAELSYTWAIKDWQRWTATCSKSKGQTCSNAKIDLFGKVDSLERSLKNVHANLRDQFQGNIPDEIQKEVDAWEAQLRAGRTVKLFHW